jgi:hypothetical protein
MNTRSWSPSDNLVVIIFALIATTELLRGNWRWSLLLALPAAMLLIRAGRSWSAMSRASKLLWTALFTAMLVSVATYFVSRA